MLRMSSRDRQTCREGKRTVKNAQPLGITNAKAQGGGKWLCQRNIVKEKVAKDKIREVSRSHIIGALQVILKIFNIIL
jgi:hypothetical protein